MAAELRKDEEAAVELRAGIGLLCASRRAAVFFTGGTTGMPKAVPHTHHGQLWFAQRCDEVMQGSFAPGVANGGTVCFTPYFHVMG